DSPETGNQTESPSAVTSRPAAGLIIESVGEVNRAAKIPPPRIARRAEQNTRYRRRRRTLVSGVSPGGGVLPLRNATSRVVIAPSRAATAVMSPAMPPISSRMSLYPHLAHNAEVSGGN